METVKKTKSGWMVETTDTIYGMLEQGGVSGRRVLYKTATLETHGLHNASPTGYDLSDNVTNIVWLLHCVTPDKILARGHTIY
jgi:hypothetical protein